MTDYILILITAASPQEAENIAKAVVEQKLAACGNIVPDIRSVFWWKQTIETEQEALLILKSKTALFASIVDVVNSLHSYEVPEILAIPIAAGSESYLTWIEEEAKDI
jgi:periplasmic divalent cation tolerance protein